MNYNNLLTNLLNTKSEYFLHEIMFNQINLMFKDLDMIKMISYEHER